MEKDNKTRLSILSRQHVAKKILAVLVVISLSFFGGWIGARAYLDSSNRDQQAENARRIINEESELISSIAENVGPSVVSVNVVSSTGQRNFFGEVVARESAGTGFIVSDDGYILTNRHVIPSGTTEVSVTMSDGTELEDVEVVGRTQNNDPLDIAFLKVNDAEGRRLTPVELGDSDQMEVGDMAVAIGNALGQFQNTVTSGIISGFGRSVTAQGGEGGADNLQNLFQTDAAINQGNSGGPLVNADGQVIAINTAVAGGGAENVGFAIPINDAKGLIQGIISQGELLRPYIGVRYIQLNSDVAKELEIAQAEGAYISEDSAQGPGVLPNSPAAEAGLQSGDIILKVNGNDVTNERPLTSAISRFAVGETVEITYLRGDERRTASLTLEAAPSR